MPNRASWLPLSRGRRTPQPRTKVSVHRQHERKISTFNYHKRYRHGQTSRYMEQYLSQTAIEWTLIGCKWHATVAQMARKMIGRIIYCRQNQFRITAHIDGNRTSNNFCQMYQTPTMNTNSGYRTIFNAEKLHIQLNPTILPFIAVGTSLCADRAKAGRKNVGQ